MELAEDASAKGRVVGDADTITEVVEVICMASNPGWQLAREVVRIAGIGCTNGG